MGTPDSAAVDVKDNDNPENPQVSISAGGGISEGGNARFTLATTPNPAGNLTFTVQVTTIGDFGVANGHRQVTIPTSGSVTF